MKEEYLLAASAARRARTQWGKACEPKAPEFTINVRHGEGQMMQAALLGFQKSRYRRILRHRFQELELGCTGIKKVDAYAFLGDLFGPEIVQPELGLQ